jgi:hypothetical protein
MEPVNLRLGIAQRIQERAIGLGVKMDMSIYDGGSAWVKYATQSLKDAERAAKAHMNVAPKLKQFLAKS